MQHLVDQCCSSSDQENKQVFLDYIRPPAATVLDLGCHGGKFTLQIAQKAKAKSIHGLEISPGNATNAHALGINVIRFDLNQPLPYQDHTFDLITANQIIEHLYFTDDFIQQVIRILKPGGQLVISTTNLAALHYRFQLLIGQQPITLHPSETQFGNPLRGHPTARWGHKSVFTHQAFLQFLQHHGLTIDHHQTVRFVPFPPAISQLLLQLFPNFGVFSTVSCFKPKK